MFLVTIFLHHYKIKQSEFIPKRKLRSYSNQPKWMTYKLLDIIGRKKGAYRKIQKGETHLTGYYHIKKKTSQSRGQESKKEL